MAGLLSRHQVEGTVMQELDVESSKLTVHAVCFPAPIDLEKVKVHFQANETMSDSPLIIKQANDAYAVLLPFGAVVFWNCPVHFCQSTLKLIQDVPGMPALDRQVGDSFTVLLGQPEEFVTFRDIGLRSLTLEHIKITSEVFGQSIALKHCERSVAQAIQKTSGVVRALEEQGEFKQSTKETLKTVGFTMAVRGAIVGQLSLFDDPEETWSSETLARLHGKLHDHFDIKKRVENVSEKVKFLSDLNEMLITLLHNRTGHRLEWIVILLIVIEVIFSFVHTFAAWH